MLVPHSSVPVSTTSDLQDRIPCATVRATPLPLPWKTMMYQVYSPQAHRSLRYHLELSGLSSTSALQGLVEGHLEFFVTRINPRPI
ncbi:hypothetical protein R6Z07F_012067 [Ovis aries]